LSEKRAAVTQRSNFPKAIFQKETRYETIVAAEKFSKKLRRAAVTQRRNFPKGNS